MRGHVIFHDLKFVWETVEEPNKGAESGPGCTLNVCFGDLCVARSFATPLTKAQAQQEAIRLAPEVLRPG